MRSLISRAVTRRSLFEAAGHPTGRTKQTGEALREGFYNSLGHGVGLEVHEPWFSAGPEQRRSSPAMIAMEFGITVRSVGGVPGEDVLVVTGEGSEHLTGDFPYGLVP